MELPARLRLGDMLVRQEEEQVSEACTVAQLVARNRRALLQQAASPRHVMAQQQEEEEEGVSGTSSSSQEVHQGHRHPAQRLVASHGRHLQIPRVAAPTPSLCAATSMRWTRDTPW